MKSILLVEDEPGLVLTLSDRLRREGYQVEAVSTGEEGYARAISAGFDAILLDVMLPGKSGFDVCRDLRQYGIDTPVLMLTARGQVVDKVVGLKLGADDYLTKPFEMMELLARVEALCRRRPAYTPSGNFTFGDVHVNVRSAEIRKGRDPVALSAREFQLLCFLAENPGVALSREEILERVWQYDSDVPATRTVDVHVAWLRKKLEDNPAHPRHILTMHGLGYKFVPEG